jgi:hypothetical protein
MIPRAMHWDSSVDNGRTTHTGQVRRETLDKEAHSGPPSGWRLSVGPFPLPHKNHKS